MLFKSSRLDPQELEVIASISSIHAQMKYALSTPPRWYGAIRRNTLARAIRGSNSIEGYLVSKDDAVAAVEGEEPLDAQAATWREVLGYRNAMTFVLQLVQDPSFTFNEGVLRSLHFMMLQHDLTRHPGNWRPGPIYVRDEERDLTVYEGPPAEDVVKLIGGLVTYIRGNEDGNHILVKGAMTHLNLVMIHPFSDGNGRMARCLQTLIMAMHIPHPVFCSIEEYLGRNTQAYYEALAESRARIMEPGSKHSALDSIQSGRPLQAGGDLALPNANDCQAVRPSRAHSEGAPFAGAIVYGGGRCRDGISDQECALQERGLCQPGCREPGSEGIGRGGAIGARR